MYKIRYKNLLVIHPDTPKNNEYYGLKISNNGVVYNRKGEPLKAFEIKSPFLYFTTYIGVGKNRKSRLLRYDWAVATAWYGRDISDEEVLIHIDGDSKNDHPRNLMILPKGLPTPQHPTRDNYLNVIQLMSVDHKKYVRENERYIRDITND